ncbi:MAG TPA: hypothetical protein VFP98_00705, partial [Candidatus Polarisedimenticolia bacterium]|nr:hypothetical protein [Candidatus Polarisedimenticolia bacterium]
MRARLLPGLTLLALTCALSSAPLLAAITTQQDLERVADLFYASTAIDDSRVFDVQNLTITKDIATFTLKKGTLYLTKPLEGSTLSAVFLGEGSA